MIRLEGRHLGVGIPTEILAQLSDAGPHTCLLRDLYFQIVTHLVTEDRHVLTVRPDEVEALAAPSTHGIGDAHVLADLGILEFSQGVFALVDVDVYTRPSPLDQMTRTDAIMGWAVTQAEPFHAEQVADFLGITVALAANYLGKLARDGLLDRVRRGYYQHPVGNPVDNHGESPLCEGSQSFTPVVKPAPRARATTGITYFGSKNKTKELTTTTTTKATTNPNYEKQLPNKNLTTNYSGAEKVFSAAHKSPRATRIPDPFVIDDSMREWARVRVPNVDIDAETEDFVDYWNSTAKHPTKIDWVRTWQMWMRRATRFPGAALLPQRTATETEWRNPECPPGMDIYSEEYAALKRAAKEEWRRNRRAAR